MQNRMFKPMFFELFAIFQNFDIFLCPLGVPGGFLGVLGRSLGVAPGGDQGGTSGVPPPLDTTGCCILEGIP